MPRCKVDHVRYIGERAFHGAGIASRIGVAFRSNPTEGILGEIAFREFSDSTRAETAKPSQNSFPPASPPKPAFRHISRGN